MTKHPLGSLARLEREIEILRAASTKALDAYRAMGMGPSGWNATDRVAFAELANVLDRPQAVSLMRKPPPRDASDHATVACRMLVACREGAVIHVNASTWEGILIEADRALPGYRRSVEKEGRLQTDLLPAPVDGIMMGAAYLIYTDVMYGLSDVATLGNLVAAAEEALASMPLVNHLEPEMELAPA